MLKNYVQNQSAIYAIPWMVLLLAPLCGTFLGNEQTELFGAQILLISAVFFGLPHGACDLWILQKTVQNQSNPFQSLAKYFFIYLALAVITVALWFFFPNLSLIGFLLLTAWHFGSGDAIWEKENTNLWWLDSLGRGLIVIFAPIAFHSLLSSRVLIGLTGDVANSNVELIIKASPFLVGIGISALVIETILSTDVSNMRSRLFKWIEICLLLVMFWLTSPLLAVTFYLIGVHSWRHILRLEVYANEAKKPVKKIHILQTFLNFHRRALPMTALSLIGLFGIFWFWHISLNNIFQMTYGYLILLSALTVPHASLISWMETKNSSLFAVYL